ncbi:hypothetical protein [Rhodopila sp.]|uniref:hypothetical protein n=1 Tax=Rhodopila sp. TaxID=2480087 RepID=UPI002C077F19|nr:hypothetical protein [Rhodopila sp.]HVZ10657.1 hypothetical protein [Rhodopila sp.]
MIEQETIEKDLVAADVHADAVYPASDDRAGMKRDGPPPFACCTAISARGGTAAS